MRRLIIANSFSLSMLDRYSQRGTPFGYEPDRVDTPRTARVPRPCGKYLVMNYRCFWLGDDGELVSAVGHSDTAACLTEELGFEVAHNRISVKLKEDDVLFVAQLVGPRLPEGATQLPKGASFEWWII